MADIVLFHADTGRGARDLAWHPKKLVLAVVCLSGSILLWTQVQKENWSAFAPDFRELAVNEVIPPPFSPFITPLQGPTLFPLAPQSLGQFHLPMGAGES